MAELKGTRRRVVVVEDDDDSRQVLCRLLRTQGFEVTAFAHANGGVDPMAVCDPQFALLDVRMPGRSGDDLGRELAGRCPGARIIFLTAEDALTHLKAFVPSCFVLRKPIDVAALLELMRCA